MRVPNRKTTEGTRQEVQPGVWLDSRLAVWLATERLLVIADLHWGYSAAHRARGNLLPAWGDEQLRDRLESLLADYSPGEMLWLGDVVHAAEGAAGAERFLRETSVPTSVLAGNHDRRWRGNAETSTRRGRYFFHHGDANPPVPSGCVEVIGHHHPAVTWADGAGTNLKLPALIASRERLVLPAFSPWAAGADCTSLLDVTSTLWAIAPQRVFAVACRTGNPAAV